MKKQFTDEQLDQMMRTLISDASVDDELLHEISDSPATLWAVRRSINSQEETAKSPWPPANIVRRWLLIGVPTAAAATMAISLFVFRPAQISEEAHLPKPADTFSTPAEQDGPALVAPKASNDSDAGTKVIASVAPRTRAIQAVSKRRVIRTAASFEKRPEIKTDFIALTYAPSAESGQVVRVKVPGSMMVTLGVLASTEKPAALVDAEVLIGDDGLTRAIRFIHQ